MNMAADGAALVEARAGATFGIELYAPWDAPEAVVDVFFGGCRALKDVIGLVGRREGEAESRVLQGRDAHSVRVLVPDCRGVDQNFHDVTIVDMGDMPESPVYIPELSTLSQQWPLAVLSHMGWCQKELEEMRAAAKVKFCRSRPSCCEFCRSLIKSDMYRHVAPLHLDVAQLWQCPVSWCTVWKGTPQDSMDHLRGTHNVPGEVKSACLEKFLLPWTVSRKLWSDSLSAQHSGISTDMLLFSDIHLSLVHHYRVHKHGLPHIAFRRNYLLKLHVLLPSPVTLPPARVVSPDSSGSGSLRPVSSPEVVLDPAGTMRRAHRQRRPVRVEEPAVMSVPVLTLQDPLAAVGAVVLDCRPSLLPVSMDISGVDMSAVRLPAMSAAMDGLLPGREQLSTGGDLLGLICPELGGPWYRPGGRAADSGRFPGGSHRRGHAFVPNVGRRRGSGAGSLGDGGLAGNGGGCSCWSGSRESSSRCRCTWFPRLLRWLPLDCPRLRRRRVPRQMSVHHLVWQLQNRGSLGVRPCRWNFLQSLICFRPPMTPSRMVGGGVVVPGSMVSSPAGDTEVAGATRDCPICLWRAPLTFTRIGPCRELHRECWMVCRAASTA